MLKSYPDGNVRVFFMLHTNGKGEPAMAAADAQAWNDFAKWSPNGETLIDGERKGNKAYFGGLRSSSMILKKGFVIHKLESENYKADVAIALSSN